MIISHTSKTAIKSLVYIASEMPNERVVTVFEIASGIDESQHTIRKILQLLSKHNIVSSSQGKHGGFFIEKEQLNTKLMKIVELFDGKENIRSCILGLHKCSETKPCPLHKDLEAARNSVLKILQQRTIRDLSKATINKITFLLN